MTPMIKTHILKPTEDLSKASTQNIVPFLQSAKATTLYITQLVKQHIILPILQSTKRTALYYTQLWKQQLDEYINQHNTQSLDSQDDETTDYTYCIVLKSNGYETTVCKETWDEFKQLSNSPELLKTIL